MNNNNNNTTVLVKRVHRSPIAHGIFNTNYIKTAYIHNIQFIK